MSATKKRRMNVNQDTKNIPSIINTLFSLHATANWMTSYRKDRDTMDSSDIMRTYYARIRQVPRVNPDYVRYVQYKLNMSNEDDAILFLIFESDTIFDDTSKLSYDGYIQYMHRRAMTLIPDYVSKMVSRIEHTKMQICGAIRYHMA
jgi:hypothetical protein